MFVRLIAPTLAILIATPTAVVTTLCANPDINPDMEAMGCCDMSRGGDTDEPTNKTFKRRCCCDFDNPGSNHRTAPTVATVDTANDLRIIAASIVAFIERPQSWGYLSPMALPPPRGPPELAIATTLLHQKTLLLV